MTRKRVSICKRWVRCTHCGCNCDCANEIAEALEERLIPLEVTDEMLDAYEDAVPSNGVPPDSVAGKAIRLQRKIGMQAALSVLRGEA